MFSKLQIIEETITVSLFDKEEISIDLLNDRVKKAGDFFMYELTEEDQEKLIKNLENRFQFKMAGRN